MEIHVPIRPEAEKLTRYLFVHVSKCGGTSLRNAISAALPGDQAFFLSTGDLHEALAGVDVRSLRVVGGHTPLWVFTRPSALLESPWEAFTVLREPVERLLSLFHYLTASEHSDHARFRGLDLRRFCDFVAGGERPDLQTCYYFSPRCAYAEARDAILTEGVAVYTIDEMPSLTRALGERLGVGLEDRRDNRSRRVATREDLKAIDLGFLEEDARLYAAARRGDFPRLA